MVTLRWRCSAELPTGGAVQMARDALRRGFVLPETVCHPAIDSQVMSLAYLLMAYEIVPEPRKPDTITGKRRSAAVTVADRPGELTHAKDYSADTSLSDTIAVMAAEPAMVET